jgi:hypothetical protein
LLWFSQIFSFTFGDELLLRIYYIQEQHLKGVGWDINF